MLEANYFEAYNTQIKPEYIKGYIFERAEVESNTVMRSNLVSQTQTQTQTLDRYYNHC